MSITVRNVVVPGRLCNAEQCHRPWLSILKHLPERCPRRDCRSRQWNGAKQRSHVNEIKLPAPRRPGRPKSGAEADGDGFAFDLPTSNRGFSGSNPPMTFAGAKLN